jgi:hypothetical protein
MACAYLIAAAGAAQDGQSSEYNVKAAFLVNFTKFIEWPADAPGDAPFQICVVGEDPFNGVLDRMAEGETVGGHRLEVVKLRRNESHACRVLFVGRSESDVPRVLAGAGAGAGVLTVGESERFLREGGIIAFVVENRKVRFDVNQGAAARAGLQISSRLLSVARSVER